MLIDQLRQQQDTRVTHLVTWVRSGMDPAAQRMGLDIASYNFRKMLLELNEENAKALFLLQGHDCLRARTVGSSMPMITK